MCDYDVQPDRYQIDTLECDHCSEVAVYELKHNIMADGLYCDNCAHHYFDTQCDPEFQYFNETFTELL